jgi:hypothetical protein
MEASR